MTLRKKIAGLAGVILVLSWIAGAFQYLAQTASKEHGIAREMESAMLQARRSEKDFLARKDLKYADLVDRAIAHFDSLSLEVRSFDRLYELKSSIRAYLDSFHELVAKHRQRGLTENDGVQAEFRSNVHAIEAAVKDKGSAAMIAMLQARRSEKDYMLRGKEEYVKKVESAILQLRDIGDARVGSLADEYLIGFNHLVGIDRQISNVNERLREAVHRSEPILEEMALSTKELAAA